MMFVRSLWILPFILGTSSACQTQPSLSISTTNNSTCLSNQFLFASISQDGAISFGGNLGGGSGDDSPTVGTLSLSPKPSSVKIQQGDNYVQVESSYDEEGILDTLSISLSEDERFYTIKTSTTTSTSAAPSTPVYRSFLFQTSSITAFYDGSGPVQMKDANQDEGHFYSQEKLSRVYSLGAEGGDVSETIPCRAADSSVDIKFEEETPSQTVIFSGSSNLDGGLSGFQTLLVGDLPIPPKMDMWGAAATSAPSSPKPVKSSTSSFKLSATNRDLPGLSVPADWDESSLPLTDLQVRNVTGSESES